MNKDQKKEKHKKKKAKHHEKKKATSRREDMSGLFADELTSRKGKEKSLFSEVSRNGLENTTWISCTGAILERTRQRLVAAYVEERQG